MGIANKTGVYDSQQAADFLGLSENQMKKLLEKKLITARRYNKKTFFLGGELDMAKSMLKQSPELMRELGPDEEKQKQWWQS